LTSGHLLDPSQRHDSCTKHTLCGLQNHNRSHPQRGSLAACLGGNMQCVPRAGMFFHLQTPSTCKTCVPCAIHHFFYQIILNRTTLVPSRCPLLNIRISCCPNKSPRSSKSWASRHYSTNGARSHARRESTQTYTTAIYVATGSGPRMGPFSFQTSLTRTTDHMVNSGSESILGLIGTYVILFLIIHS
jgi:hypothetical protein